MRVLRPSILGALIYVLISAMESFEIPGVIGMRAGIQVLAFKIYLPRRIPSGLWNDQYSGRAVARDLRRLDYLLREVFARRREIRNSHGKAYRAKVVDLGSWKAVATALIAAYFVVTVVSPLAVLVWTSLLPFYQAPSVKAFSNLSLANYRALFEIPKVSLALWNTFFMVLLAPTVTMFICSVLSWIIVKSRGRGRNLLDFLTFMPHAIPGIVTGVALMWVYIFLPLPIYGTIWILLIAYVTSRISFGTRVMNAAMTQLHKELEEASYASGGSWLRTFWRITFLCSCRLS